MPFSVPAWSHRATRKCCPCRRSSSPRKTGRRSRIASAMPPSVSNGPARSKIAHLRPVYPRGRSVRLPTDRRRYPRHRRQLHPSPASRPRTRTIAEYLQGCRWKSIIRPSANGGKRTTTIYRWRRRRAAARHRRCHPGQPGSPSRSATPRANEAYYNGFVTRPAGDHRRYRGRTGRLQLEPRWKIENRKPPSTCSKPPAITLSTTSATASRPWPASSSRSTCLAFAFHTAGSPRRSTAWQEAVACPAAQHTSSFENLRTITAYCRSFQHWPHLLQSIARRSHPAALTSGSVPRPPLDHTQNTEPTRDKTPCNTQIPNCWRFADPGRRPGCGRVLRHGQASPHPADRPPASAVVRALTETLSSGIHPKLR